MTGSSAGAGATRCCGGTGRDLLIGGAGRDRVVLRARPRSSGARSARPRSWTRRPARSRTEAASTSRARRPAKPDAFLVAAGRHRRLQAGRRDVTARAARRAAGHRRGRSVTPRTRTARPTSSRAATSPTWGRHKARTRPAVGNHEYGTPGAARLLRLLRRRGRRARQGLVQLRPRRLARGRAELQLHRGRRLRRPAREQERWLRADLAANAARCTLAYMHHPRFSSGNVHGGSSAVRAAVARARGRRRGAGAGGPRPRLRALRATDAGRRARRERGVRQFVVGTGGAAPALVRPAASRTARCATTPPSGCSTCGCATARYDWRFVAQPGSSFARLRHRTCH